MRYFLNKRNYYLKEKDGLRKYIQSRIWKKETLIKTDNFFSWAQIDSLNKKVKINFFEEIKKNPVELELWEKANQELKTALQFSYWISRYYTPNKIGNIEIGYPWIEDDKLYFTVHLKQLWQSLIKFLFNDFFDEIIRNTGTHVFSCRYGKVHLVIDNIGQRQIFGIHYDRYYPKVFSLDGIKHLLRDDALA